MAWKGDSKTWIKGCDKMLALLEKEFQTASKKNADKKAKKLAKWQETIEIYKTEEDVQDAYGYGMITDVQRQELIAFLEKGEAELTALDEIDAYIYLLQCIARDMKQEKECLIEEAK